jgi:hypothetical protein
MGASDRRLSRLAARNQAECGFRVVEGEHPRLSAGWRHGVATLSKGRITFRPYLPPGIRIPRPFTPPVEIAIASINPPGREPHGAELWSVSSQADVLSVNTGTARLECAVLRAQRDWIIETVG